MSSASPSQSSRSSSTASVLPDVSPLRHSSSRERLQNQASPVSRVSRSASSFIQASISTRPVAASCTIAGRSVHRSGTPSSRSSSRSDVSRSGSSCRIEASSAACATSSASATCSRVAGAARGDHRQVDRVGDRRGQLEVVAGARAVGVDRRQQDLARAAAFGLARPVDGAAAGLGRARPRAHASLLGVDRDDDRLRAESRGELGHELRALERGRVDRDLVGAGGEQLLAVLGAAHAAADRERDREPLGDLGDERDQRRALLERRLHVEEHELVGAGVRVRRAELDRVADVAQALEANALDDAAAGHVEARDQARERHRSSASSR